MGIGVVKNRTTLALVEETTEGTYKAPTNGADYVEMLSEGGEFLLERDALERDVLSSTVEVEAARVGIKNVTGTVPVEYRANSTVGSAPVDLDVMLKSLLGGKRQISSQVTTGIGHTSTVLQIEDADIGDFSVGDIIKINESGAHELRPITAVDTSVGAANITLGIALDNGAPSDNVVIEKSTIYFPDQANSVTFSAEHNMGGEIQEQVRGLRSASMSLENWSVGQLPTASFSLQGLGLDRVDAAPTASPNTNAALPPVILQACLWLSGIKVEYSEFSASLENTISQLQSACEEDGKISSRVTQFLASGAVNPYMEDDDVDRFTDFEQNDDISIFTYAFNPSSTTGEFNEAVGIWIPQAKIMTIPAADVEGIFADGIEWRAHRSSGNDSIFLGFV